MIFVMNIKDLESFLLTAKLGSFSAAANHLGASQPTISARISKLEEQIGQRLFDRTRQPLRPTRKGLEILPFAEQIVESSQNIHVRSSLPKAQNKASMRIGTHTSLISSIVPRLVAEFSKLFPRVDIDFDVGTAYDLRDRLAQGSIDFCIMEEPSEFPNSRVVPLIPMQAKWMARKGSIPGKRIEGDELTKYTIVTYKKWSRVFRVIDLNLRNRRTSFNNLVTSDSTDAIASVLSNPNTIGTVYSFASDNIGYGIDLEEIDVDVELPRTMLTLCYVNPPKFISASQLSTLVRRLLPPAEGASGGASHNPGSFHPGRSKDGEHFTQAAD